METRSTVEEIKRQKLFFWCKRWASDVKRNGDLAENKVGTQKSKQSNEAIEEINSFCGGTGVLTQGFALAKQSIA
jgi:hypothetical protein